MNHFYVFTALALGVFVGFMLSALLRSNGRADEADDAELLEGLDDTLRLDAIETHKWNVTNLNEVWAVMDGETNHIESLGEDLRACLDTARKKGPTLG